MAMKHSIYDTDSHFLIDPITRKITNMSSQKTTLIQGDHNSERFTFEIPRYIEGHDMSLCDKIEVHYINISASNKYDTSADVYKVNDKQISPLAAEKDVVIFSWLISGNATKYAGVLNFLICFTCLDGVMVEYSWNTGIFSDISIGAGMNNGEAVIREYSDVLEVWKNKLISNFDIKLEKKVDKSSLVTQPLAGSVPKYNAHGNIRGNAAQDGLDYINLNLLNLRENKLRNDFDAKTNELTKRIEILQGQNLETLSDTGTSYEKKVPSGVASYAVINKTATMSSIPRHVICQHTPYHITEEDIQRGTVDFDISWTRDLYTHITVVIRDLDSNVYLNPRAHYVGNTELNSPTDCHHYIVTNIGRISLACDRSLDGTYFDLVVLDYEEEDLHNVPDMRSPLGTEALVKIISLTDSGEQIDEYVIPTAVKDIPTYKERLIQQCNYVDFDVKEYQEFTDGLDVFTPERKKDISEHLDDYDEYNFIEVNEGGKLIFENAAQGDIESVVTYMRRNVVKDDSSGFEYILIDDAYYISCGTAVIGTNLVIPSEHNGIKVKGIASDGFSCISQLKSVTIPEGVSVISCRAFSGCTALEHISIPDSIEIIQEDSFKDCSQLNLFESDNGLYLGNNSNNHLVLFTTNKEIDTFEFKSTTKVIYQAAFKNSQVVNLGKMPDDLKYIGWGVFSGCMKLESDVVIPHGIKVLENYTFNNCRSLKKITLPDSLTTIGRWSVALCTSLTEINIPESVNYIGQKAFYWCGKLNTNLTIPKNTNIENNAFEACVKVKNIVIGHGVSIIPLECFKDCWELVSIKIPASILSIGSNAFQSCNKLETVYYPGHQTNWNNIAIGKGNENLKNADIVYSS